MQAPLSSVDPDDSSEPGDLSQVFGVRLDEGWSWFSFWVAADRWRRCSAAIVHLEGDLNMELQPYRRTGADLLRGDPLSAHPGVRMEGYFRSGASRIPVKIQPFDLKVCKPKVLRFESCRARPQRRMKSARLSSKHSCPTQGASGQPIRFGLVRADLARSIPLAMASPTSLFQVRAVSSGIPCALETERL